MFGRVANVTPDSGSYKQRYSNYKSELLHSCGCTSWKHQQNKPTLALHSKKCLTDYNLYIKVPILHLWPARDWWKPPSVKRQRHIRWRQLNDDVVLLRLFTLHYCTIVAVSATSDTAGKFAIGQGVLWACGMTDNRVVSLDTVTTWHYSAPRKLPIMSRDKGEAAHIGT